MFLTINSLLPSPADISSVDKKALGTNIKGLITNISWAHSKLAVIHGFNLNCWPVYVHAVSFKYTSHRFMTQKLKTYSEIIVSHLKKSYTKWEGRSQNETNEDTDMLHQHFQVRLVWTKYIHSCNIVVMVWPDTLRRI